VTMKIDKDKPVKTDSIATIKFGGLLGQNFVSISFGTPEGILITGPDQTLETTEQADLNALMQKLESGMDNLTEAFSSDTFDKLFGPINAFLKDNSGPLSDTITNVRNVSAQIAAGEGTVGRLIFEDTLYTSALNTVSNLQSTSDEIRSTIADARKVVDEVNAGQGTLGKLVKDEALYHETTASMTNLREILEKINQGQGTVGKLVNEQEFYKNAKLTLQKVDKATEGLEDQGPLSVIGILANGLF